MAKQNHTLPLHLYEAQCLSTLGSAAEETVTLSLFWCNNRFMVPKGRDATGTQRQHRDTQKEHDSSAVVSFVTAPKVPAFDLCRESRESMLVIPISLSKMSNAFWQ